MLSWIALVAPEKMMPLLFYVHLRDIFFFFFLKFVDCSFSSVQKAYILGPFGLSLFLLKLKTETENTVVK